MDLEEHETSLKGLSDEGNLRERKHGDLNRLAQFGELKGRLNPRSEE